MAGWTTVLMSAVLGWCCIHYLSRPSMPLAKGSCTKAFKAVEQAFRENYKLGTDSGSAFAVYHDGELVCDLWGGWSDANTFLPWTKNTLALVFSTVKTAASLCVALLCDRGFCSYEELVSAHWQEFGQNGKENITIGMLLSHQAGLAAINETLTLEMIAEKPNDVGRVLAEQSPNWSPGNGSGYHALTFGMLTDQLVRRIDPHHRPLHEFFAQEISGPFGVELHIGLPLPIHWRAAHFTEQPAWQAVYESLFDPDMPQQLYHLLFNAELDTDKVFFNPEVRDVNWPSIRTIHDASFNGYGTACAMAWLLHLVTVPGHHCLKPLLSPSAITKLHTPLFEGLDRVLGVDMHYGPGMVIFPNVGNQSVNGIGHFGKGGQLVLGIQALNVSLAYITNHPSAYFSPMSDPRVASLLDKLLGVLTK